MDGGFSHWPTQLSRFTPLLWLSLERTQLFTNMKPRKLVLDSMMGGYPQAAPKRKRPAQAAVQVLPVWRAGFPGRGLQAPFCVLFPVFFLERTLFVGETKGQKTQGQALFFGGSKGMLTSPVLWPTHPLLSQVEARSGAQNIGIHQLWFCHTNRALSQIMQGLVCLH